MKTDTILLDHGSGGRLSHQLFTSLILPAFENPALSEMHDGAMVDMDGRRVAFSTDTYVVDPIFFPGGDIGDLAINGTVNDIAMCGATPLFLSVGFVLEEGLPLAHLGRILNSMRAAAERAGVKVVTGDTKVVPRGAADKIFVNTSGIGLIPEGVEISSNRARPGDEIILSGTIADHGATILIQREGLHFESAVTSDTAPLNHMVHNMLAVCPHVHVLRDPTRGGVGTALNEIAETSNVGIKIFEDRIPVRDDVSGICELLGLDPLYVANEGKLLAFVRPEDTNDVLTAIKKDSHGANACVIGEVLNDHQGRVYLETPVGGNRIVDMLTGEQLPRIC
jgi:hydrogenase expression/formation protein HypE